jgi:hypothetical protein
MIFYFNVAISVRHDQTSPRWKKMNTEESPITDLTVVFSGDSAPDRFSKVLFALIIFACKTVENHGFLLFLD